MDDQFEFKTIRALGRFLGVSESQAGRLLNGECQTTHTFHLKEWNEQHYIGFALYGTPIESTTYKFAKCLQKRFGIIEGVTDKNFITNSYHIRVTEEIDAFSKLSFESQFQSLSLGGGLN